MKFFENDEDGIIKSYKKGKSYYVFGCTFIIMLIWIILEVLYSLFLQHSLKFSPGPPMALSYTSNFISSFLNSITIVPIVFYFINLSFWNKVVERYNQIIQSGDK
jgi:hypothetical protein